MYDCLILLHNICAVHIPQTAVRMNISSVCTCNGFNHLVTRYLADHLGDALAVPVVEIVEGEHVVHAAACHHVAAGGEHRRHNPG